MRHLLPRLAILLLSLSLLAGCGDRESPPREGILSAATGIASDTVLFTADRRAVTAGQYFYALASACDAICAAYQEAGTAMDWSESLSGQTLGDYAQRQALASAVLYATVENQAERFGCALSETDLEKIDADWEQKTAEYGSETRYLDALALMGLNRDSARQLAADRQLYLQLYTLYCTAGSALYPTPAALDAFAKSQAPTPSTDHAPDSQTLSDAYFDFWLQTAADNAEIVYSAAWKPTATDEFYTGLTAARASLPTPVS